MKALILAGGFATRLRPLSLSRPKQLFLIVNKPLLSFILDNLSRHGVYKAILAVNYKADQIRAAIGNSYDGMKIEYAKEEVPLGTGGPIKRLQRKLGDESHFIAMNGDILADINLNEMLAHHSNQKNSPVATIALVKVKNPARFGVAKTNSAGRVEKFIEKPNKKSSRPAWVNAGVYILSKKIFEYLKAGPASIEKEVFPVLAEKELLQSFTHRGYWSDIGQPEDYLAANICTLNTMNSLKVILSDGCTTSGPVNFIPPVVLGKDCHIQRGATIGPYAILGRGVEVGHSCKISQSILFEKTIVKARTRISNSLIGGSVFLGEQLELTDMSIVADGAKITSHAQTLRGMIVQPGQQLG